MKRIYIVEDETLVRIGIKAMLDDRNQEYSVVGDADSGIAAVDDILKMRPDIVLLDITIPQKNGLEVLREIREQGYRGYVIMLTCHEEFQIVQQALRYGANDYVLKSDLNSGTLFSYMDVVADQKTVVDDNKIPDDNSLKRENFLCNLFMTGLEKDEDFLSACKNYDLQLSNKGLFFMLLHICDYTEIIKRYERQNQDMLFSAVNTMLKESLSQVKKFEIVRLSPDNHVVLISMDGIASVQRINEILQSVVRHIEYNMENFMNIRITIGVSSEVRSLRNINVQFNKLVHLLDRSYFFPEERVEWQSEYSKDNTFSAAFETFKQEMEKLQKENGSDSFRDIMERFLKACKPTGVQPDKGAFLYSIQEIYQNLSKRIGITEQNLSAALNIDQITAKMDELLNNFSNIEKPNNYLVMQAIKFIDSNFAKDITMEEIAAQIGVSANYLSRIFAREVGRNVSTYINEKRIEYAKYLLTNTSMKHYEIAEKCGLNSAAYYTSVFKKMVGVTPNQYRNTSQALDN